MFLLTSGRLVCLNDSTELCMFKLLVFFISDPVLQYLLAGLQESRLASVAATALQSISTTCKEHMKSHCDGLVQIAQAIDTFNISNDAATGLLRGMYTVHLLVIVQFGFLVIIKCKGHTFS